MDRRLPYNTIARGQKTSKGKTSTSGVIAICFSVPSVVRHDDNTTGRIGVPGEIPDVADERINPPPFVSIPLCTELHCAGDPLFRPDLKLKLAIPAGLLRDSDGLAE